MLRSSLVVLVLFVMSASPARAEWMFRGLDLRGLPDISADGSTVIGGGLRWKDDKLISVGGVVEGVSADGSVIVGHASSPAEAFRWSVEPGQEIKFEFLGVQQHQSSSGHGVSADGSVVVGTLQGGVPRSEAFRWEDGDMVGLGTFGGNRSQAAAVSADGSVIAGMHQDQLNACMAFRWEDGATVDLGTLGGVTHAGYSHSAADAISADGNVIVGNSMNLGGITQAFRWENGSMVGLETFGGLTSLARDVSADGSTIVGWLNYPNSSRMDAVLWEAGQLYFLRDLLIDHNVDVLGWDLRYANGISDDGTVIAGFGIDPLGAQRSWIATIPEPSSLILLIVGAVCVLLFTRRR